MAFDNRRDGRDNSKGPVAGPWGSPPAPARQRPSWTSYVIRNKLSILLFVLICVSFGVRMYRDLSTPDAWAYWKDQYFSPSMTSQLATIASLDGSGRRVAALAVRGKIGPASAGWFRDRVDEAHLQPGDTVLLSSPGGDLDQAIIMGEIIRSRGLDTAVGKVDGSGQVAPSYCASACVLAYAGGKSRFGVTGSRLGVHRFVATRPADDPVADAQRTTGALLNYFTRMGVSPTVLEAMSATGDIRWLTAKEAETMNLITDPAGPKSAAR
jgi:hypothetical protein